MAKKKNPAAVILGKRGVAALKEKYTEAEVSQIRRKAAAKRWKNHKYSQSASARSHRKQRAEERENKKETEQ
jgi:hypothetical protein